jgi:hypothetical protein
MRVNDILDYWRMRCVKAEELLIHVGCDPKWTATVDEHFDKVRLGDKAKYQEPPTAAVDEAK